SKKKAKITEQPNPLQTLPPGLRLPLRLFATDRFPIKCLNIYSLPEIFGSYDRKVLITVKIKPSSLSPFDLKLLKPLSVQARSYASEGPKDYNLLGNLTPTSPELDVKKPQDIVRPGSLILLAEAYDRCVQ
ncbi:hypothetical protein HID58_060200, partial [Brassica napus]